MLFSWNVLFCMEQSDVLEHAYQTLFYKEFGYTLIGEKPVSIEEEIESRYLYDHPEALEQFLASLQASFQNSKTLVLKIFREDRNCFIECIHKEALGALLNKNTALQNFVKENFASVEEFYAKVFDPKMQIVDVLKRRADLFGIVLGYGETNANYFCRRVELSRYLKKFPLVRFFSTVGRKANFPQKIVYPYREHVPSKNEEFDSFQDEWDWMQSHSWDLRGEREASPPYFIALPFYMCLHGGDSEQVREKYCHARDRLAEIFYQKSARQAVIDVVE